MKNYLFEVRGYSPTSYDFYHLGVCEGQGENSDAAAAEAWKTYTGPKTFGSEPVSMKVVTNPDTYQWAKGYKR